MLTYYITSGLTAVTCVGMAVIILRKKPFKKLHIQLLRLNICVALWSFFLLLHYLAKGEKIALTTVHILHIFAILIPSFYLHFVTSFLNLKKPNIIKIAYSVSSFFIISSFTPYFIKKVEPKIFFNFYATAGPLYTAWIFSYISLSAYGIYLLIKNYQISIPERKNQIRYLIASSAIGFTGGITIFPLFYNIQLPPIGEHIIFLYPLIFSVAVIKHNLLDLNIVIKRTIVYSLSVILITLIYLVTVLILEKLLRNFVGYQSFLTTLIAAVSIAIIFTPIKNKIQSFIDKLYVTTTYQRLQKELLESDKRKALSVLAAGMAHEIRNPLTAIKTFAEYLPQKYNDSIFREKFSRLVTSETERINALIIQLLEFAKPSKLRNEELNINNLLDDTLDLLSGEMVKHNIELVKEFTTNSSMVIKADAIKIKHVLFNILKNSIEAIGRNGRIIVKTTRKDKLQIEISDTGCGMKIKDIGRIFEPFYSSKESGTGLGLAVVQSIVKEHNGIITVKSTPGIGTCFTVTL
ncbi:MAG: ATP-binding protein [Candidatus Omnitrophota bacterium]